MGESGLFWLCRLGPRSPAFVRSARSQLDDLRGNTARGYCLPTIVVDICQAPADRKRTLSTYGTFKVTLAGAFPWGDEMVRPRAKYCWLPR